MGSGSIGDQLLMADLYGDCPSCGYAMWMRYSEVIVGATLLCPCCRTNVQLIDSRGGVSVATHSLDDALRDGLKGFKL
jgi:hypothetical protein